jgi:hypothetical protein
MIDKDSIRALLRSEHSPAVSVYLPTHVAGREIRQDPIRFRTLLDAAAERLLRTGMRKPEIEEVLEPGYQLVRDETFWRHQDRGLAVFLAPGFSLHVKAPIELPEEVVTARHFHVKHLLPLVQEDGRFWLVTVSAGRARLFEGTRYTLQEKDVQLPRGIAEIAAETDYQEGIQRSPVSRPRTAGTTGPGPRGAGHPGDAPEGHAFEDQQALRKAEFIEYMHRVVARIEDPIKAAKAPLVVIAEPEARGHFKAFTERLAIIELDIDLNPDAVDEAELQRLAWEKVRPHYASGRQAALDHFYSLMGSGSPKAALKPDEIVKGARWGRVDTLFVADGAHLWGKFDEAQDQVVAHGSAADDDEDLLDFAASQTLLQGGRVELLPRDQLPRNGLIAAILRY